VTRIAVLLAVMLIASVPPAMEGRQENLFRARTDAVVVSAAVRARNRPVSGLTAADFELVDNGVVQELSSTSAEKVPVDVTLVVDTSGSISGAAFQKLKADIQAMANLLTRDDRVRLVTFATNVVDVAGVQSGTATLPLGRLSPGGATTFHDAVSAALMLAPSADRPQLVFAVTDGFDNASFLHPREVVNVAAYSSAALYVALLPSRVFKVVRGQRGFGMGPMQGDRFTSEMAGTGDSRERVEAPHQQAWRDAAAATGGSFYTASTNDTLPALFRRVLEDFRTNYILRYSPRGVARGGWHEITVKVPKRADVVVRARKGYEGG
jgi:VWFA-related protein